MDRSIAAYLEGNSRVEAVELARARSEISSTGRIDLMARAELRHCASHVASLVFEPCAGFEKLRQDAAPAERTYADYLAARLQAADSALRELDAATQTRSCVAVAPFFSKRKLHPKPG